MDEKIEEQKWTLKDHLKRHKVAYTAGIIAGFTLLIMRDNLSGKAHLNGHTDSGKAHLNGHTALSFIGDNSNNNSIVNVFEREGRGHPGYMIQDKLTGLVYKSQKEACDILDINYKHMSDHLNGRKEDILGRHFERVTLAA